MTEALEKGSGSPGQPTGPQLYILRSPGHYTALHQSDIARVTILATTAVTNHTQITVRNVPVTHEKMSPYTDQEGGDDV